MGRTERPLCHERLAAVQQSGDGIDLGGLHGFCGSHLRQNGRDALCQHTLAAAGAADHQRIVTAGCGDFQGILGVLLSFDIGEIQGVLIVLRLRHIGRLLPENGSCGVLQMGEQVAQTMDAVDGDAYRRCLGGIFLRDEQFPDAGLCRQQCHRQNAADAPDVSRQGNLTQKTAVFRLRRNAFHADQDAQQNGEIVHRADLFHICRRKVDCDLTGRQGDGKAGKCRPDTLPALPDRGIRQPDNFKLGLATSHADFHIHRKGIQPEQPQTFDLGKQAFHLAFGFCAALHTALPLFRFMKQALISIP